MIYLFFTNVGLVSTLCLLISRAKQMIHFRNDTKNWEDVWIIMCFFKLPLYVPPLTTRIIVWGHDLKLGLNWSSRVEPSLLKQIPEWSDMRRLSRRYLLELCLLDCYLLVLIFRFVSAQFFQMRLQYFCIQYCNTKYFCGPNFSKSWTLHAFRFGLEMSHHIVSAKNFRLERFCFLLSCISKIIYPCSVITLPFNSDGLLCQNSLLVFSWMHQLFLFWNGGCVQNFPVCFIACRLGSFGTDLYLFIQWLRVFTV